MRNEDGILIGIVAAVWLALAVMYATIPMIYMPNSVRVWGLGAVLFALLTALILFCERARER